MTTIHATAPKTYEAVVTIANDLGLHARPAALVAQTAQRFSATTTLSGADRHANAKSILDILSLAAGKGTILTIRSEGEDALACVTAITNLVRMQFHEEVA